MGSTVEKRQHKLWGVIKPSGDVPGQWVGHCLELDVITTGNSLDHCREMLREASAMVIVDDLNMGRDPYDRADREDPVWDEWRRIMQDGELRLTTSGSPNPEAYVWAVRWSVQVECVAVQPSAETTDADLLFAAA